MKKVIPVCYLILTFWAFELKAQDTITITLRDAITLGIERSVNTKVANNKLLASYWTYKTYKADMMPEISFASTFPNYSKSYNDYQNSQGEYTFVRNNYNRLDGELSLSQNLPWTGGNLSVSSSIQRLRQEGRNTRYKSVPVSITLQQPILGFNKFKWQQKIEPLKYEEGKRNFASSMEEVAHTVLQSYFNLLLSKINVNINEQNLKNAEKLYEISESKRKLGKMSEIELQQMKISLLRAQSSLIDAQTTLFSRMFDLRSLLRLGDNYVINTVTPEVPTEGISSLSYNEVLAKALENNAFTRNMQRKMIEARRDYKKSVADRWSVSLFATLGWSGIDSQFEQAYQSDNWKDNNVIRLGVKIPILDWGKGKGKVEVARSNMELVNAQAERDESDFIQDVFLLVQKFNTQPQKLAFAKETDIIAEKRYAATIEMFILGKIDILNLNDSQTSKDEARRNYIQQLHQMWSYYYQVRSLTLYDFFSGNELTTEYHL